MKFKSTLVLFFISINVFAQVPTAGLIGYYPFSGDADDQSGFHFDGTVSGATLTTDRFNRLDNAYFFNGNNNKITLSNSFDSLPRSLSAWFYANVIDNVNRMIYCSDNPNLVNGLTNLQVIIHNGTPSVATSVSSVAEWSPITSNAWHHYVTVVDSHSTRRYIDGVFMAYDTIIDLLSSIDGYSNMVIGADRDLTGSFFHGKIDDLRIYNRVLNQDEVTALFNEEFIGINEVSDQQKIKVYPNPATTFVNIELVPKYSNNDKYALQILNTLSQVVFQSKINKEAYIIDVKTWTGKGIYFVNIIDESGKVVDKTMINIQ